MSFVTRHLQNALLSGLAAHPVLFLNGPRQAGKSTLVQNLSYEHYPAEYVTMDSPIQMAAAASAPKSFLSERSGNLIIDEAQLVPELFRALKSVVDTLRYEKPGHANGRYLLTGSANVLALPRLAEPLVGRMGVLTLYPLSGSEALGGKGTFINQLFDQNFSENPNQPNILDVIKQATYPEVSAAEPKTRQLWFDGYLTTILQRDVRSLAEIQKLNIMPNLLRILAARAGGLVNDADIARDAGLNPVTMRNYKSLLAMLFLTFDVRPWYRNIGKRLVKAPKGFMVDTLLLCYLLQLEIDQLETNRPEIFGRVLENHVASELTKLIANAHTQASLYHFRTSDNKEVDFVVEQPNGRLAGIEVKAKEHVSAQDFAGLKELRKLTQADFQCGVILYRGDTIVPFGERLWALPISQLWT